MGASADARVATQTGLAQCEGEIMNELHEWLLSWPPAAHTVFYYVVALAAPIVWVASILIRYQFHPPEHGPAEHESCEEWLHAQDKGPMRMIVVCSICIILALIGITYVAWALWQPQLASMTDRSLWGAEPILSPLVFCAMTWKGYKESRKRI
jgi:hypothetical protein